MNISFFCTLLAMLLCLAVSGNSLLFAETYQWTDADGSMHFSDTPPVKASGKQPVVQRDDTSVTPLTSSKRSSTSTSAGHKQPSKQQPWKPDAACIEEVRAFDKKLSNDESFKNCMASVQSKSRQRYSPECLRQLESKKYNYTAVCQQEIQAVGQAIITEMQQCTNMRDLISSNISQNCREQGERYQKHMAICGEISQKIVRVCGQSVKCYEEHQADLADCR